MKIVIPILVVFVGILIYVLWPSAPVTNYPSSGTEIIAFGDSLVVGVGSSGSNDFVSRLERAIGEPIINLGVNGDTTADGIARLSDLTERDPKVVMLLLGGNDALRDIPLAETKANLSFMISEIHATGAIVLLLGVRGGLLSDTYKDMYPDLAKEHNTAFVPNVLDGVFARPTLMDDPIHPNNAGYEIIAEKILPVLGSVI